MQHQGTKKLETKRLLLRPFLLSDAQAMYKNWASNPNVSRYLTWSTHTCPSVTEQVVGDWCKGYSSQNYYQWAICLKELGEPIGSISVVRIDERISETEIGYCIGEHWWGQGITAEALNAVIAFLFEEVGAKRICAKHDVKNSNSGKVMQKGGMTYEGTHRRAGLNNEGICDVAVYAILR